MKQSSYLFLLFVVAIQLSSCIDKSNYAEQLKDEKELIANYIIRNKINVIDTFPKTASWGENDYYLDSKGVYFHLQNVGDGTDTLSKYNQVSFRYKEYELTENPDTISFWTSNDSPYPATFIYGDGNYTNICEAFHIAAFYMKHNEAEAKIIVPSKLGFSDNTDAVIPMGYTINMKFQK